MSTKRISILLAAFALALLAFPAFAPADVGPNATVKKDNVEVHSSMSLKSEVVKVLQKGTKLIVVSETDNPEGGWCSIREPQASQEMGYVLCRYLAEEGGTVEGGEEDKRPYSDVRVLLYMTEW